jgi:multicomponent Na+:H+ antiporter subunit F
MNMWLIAAVALALATVPCGFILARGKVMDRMVALQAATAVCVMVLTLAAVGIHRPSFLDIALSLALLSYPATMVFSHFLERWL